ncbi:TetR/AcrR family transcriptional regulator [Amycolatopsis sp.]|uniref:TetR/AcrR family transcriptional regulator n=1 Tax=Amycolatopsis sp. TaxID=37632 RepID=UPI002630B389|nr:TetR/AcrR family transcriptional regulator [Amycolatopsis sp.]
MSDAGKAVLDQLSQIFERQTAIDRAEHALIVSARENGTSWAEIALALGLGSRQAAEQRYRRLSGRVRAAHPESPVSGQGAADEHSTVDSVPLPSAPPQRQMVGQSSETRRRLVDATAEVLAERGYASTRISDIATRAGVRPGSIYHHFRSKDHLVEEVVRLAVLAAHRRVATTVAALPASATAGNRLATAMTAHLQVNIEMGVVARAHAHAFGQLPTAMKKRIRPHRRRYGALWAELVDAAISDGSLRGDIDGYLIRLFVVNSVEAAAFWAWRTHRTTSELADTVLRLVLEGAALSGAPGKVTRHAGSDHRR